MQLLADALLFQGRHLQHLALQGLAGAQVAEDSGEQSAGLGPANSLTARSSGKMAPSLRRPWTSRPMPMMCFSPVRR